MIGGSAYFPTTHENKRSQITLATKRRIKTVFVISPISIVLADIHIKINIAIISWTISIHSAIFPYFVPLSHLSDMSLTIIIVLLKVSATAIKIETKTENPSRSEIKNHIRLVKRTCPIPAIAATLPTSLIIEGLSPSPTINNSSATQK